MGVEDRREREKVEMKAKILLAAKELFLKKGFEKTSIRNIADRIEYSAGTIYLYFKDKNDLLFNLHQEGFGTLMVHFSRIDLDQNAIGKLEQMGRIYINFANENPELYELMFIMDAPMESLECKDAEWDEGMIAFEMLKNLVGECQKEGYLIGHDSEDATLMIWSFVHGLVTLKCRKRLEMFCEKDEESNSRMMRAFELFLVSIKCSYQQPK